MTRSLRRWKRSATRRPVAHVIGVNASCDPRKRQDVVVPLSHEWPRANANEKLQRIGPTAGTTETLAGPSELLARRASRNYQDTRGGERVHRPLWGSMTSFRLRLLLKKWPQRLAWQPVALDVDAQRMVGNAAFAAIDHGDHLIDGDRTDALGIFHNSGEGGVGIG